MKISLIIILGLCFIQCTGQDSNLPITVDIRVDKEYQVTRSKDLYKATIRDNRYVVNSDSVRQKYYDITVEINNKSSRPIGIWLMRCSYEDNLIVNNNYIFIKGHECDSNYPTLVKFKSGESKTYSLTLSKLIKFDYPCQNCVYGQQVETTQLGLIIIDDLYESRLKGPGYDLAMEDKSKWIIVWSNSLKLLDKQPEPKTIKN